MKKYFLLFLFFVLTEFGFAQTQFNFRYGSQLHDRARKVIQVYDGNYIVIGSTWGFGSTGDAFMMKLDVNGNIIWNKDYAGINPDEAYDVIELSNHDLVICGMTYSYGNGNYDGFVMKTDSYGNMLWGKSYGNTLDEYFYKVKEDASGGFYVAGFSYKVSTVQQEGTVLLRVDSVGNVIWNKWVYAWDAQGEWFPIDIAPIATGGVILTAPKNGISCWKFSSSGNLIWSHSYTSNGFNAGIAIIEDGSGNIFLNSVDNDNTNNYDIAVLKLQSNGDAIWCKSYGGTYTDKDRSISNTSDGKIMLCGFTNSVGNGNFDACLIKISQAGSVEWAKAYGTVWFETTANGVQTSDDGYILTGQTYSFGTNYDSSKVLLIKTDSLGNSSCNSISWSPHEINQPVTVSTAIAPDTIDIESNEQLIDWPISDCHFYEFDLCKLTDAPVFEIDGNYILYPNPFTSNITIDFQKQILKPFEIKIQNVLGQTIFREQEMNSLDIKNIDLHELQNGIYFLDITIEGEMTIKKIIKQ